LLLITHIDVKNEYIAALVYYVYKKAKTDRGTAVVVRTAEICGVDETATVPKFNRTI